MPSLAWQTAEVWPIRTHQKGEATACAMRLRTQSTRLWHCSPGLRRRRGCWPAAPISWCRWRPRPDRARAGGRHQEDPRDARITAEDGGFRIGAAVSGAELGEHAPPQGGLARRGRGGRADRLDPGPGPRHHGRQSVQRLAGGRQRAGA